VRDRDPHAVAGLVAALAMMVLAGNATMVRTPVATAPAAATFDAPASSSGEPKESVPARPEDGGASGNDPELERAAARFERRMRRFLSDLEYSPGLPEPPQQVIAPIPPPWRPDPGVTRLPGPVIDEVSPRAAAAGSYVRIRGRDLRVSAVMFGDQPAQIMSDGDDQVMVLAPPGVHGTVPVVVTNVDGGYAIALDAFRFLE
jgi:hypothetical protein